MNTLKCACALLSKGESMNRRRALIEKIERLSKLDQLLVLLYVIWVGLRRPSLKYPVHSGVVASLAMFVIIPILPDQEPLSLAILGGVGACTFFYMLAFERRGT